MANEFAGTVLLFKSFGPVANMATLHAEACNMTNTAGRKVKIIRGEGVADAVEDLLERDFPVKRCKCCK